MSGYHRNPTANAECFPGDGWFDSGDLGFLHRGRLVLTGRAKDGRKPPRRIDIIRGANIYCYEVEEIVSQIDGTVPVCVAATSVRDELLGMPPHHTAMIVALSDARHDRPSRFPCTSVLTRPLFMHVRAHSAAVLMGRNKDHHRLVPPCADAAVQVRRCCASSLCQQTRRA